MRASTLPMYLIGSRQAIFDIAASRWSALIGAIFVLSAGLAREYDGEDLIHEPWHALRPLGASLVSGGALFLLVHVACLNRATKGEGTPPSFFHAYRTFMGLFWMTAPMAWLYAIPYERFMTSVDAVRCNLWTLAFVAAWRVLLMTRVISVVYGIGNIASFFLVMLFSDAVVFAAVSLAPAPMINVMGGIRHTAADALLADVTFSVTLLSIFSAPVWIVGGMVAASTLKPRWPVLIEGTERQTSHGLLVVAIVSVLAFVPLLVVAQPVQMNRRDVERRLIAGDVSGALATMSQHTPDDYPPSWDPPPRMGYAKREPELSIVQQAMSDRWPAPWVAELFMSKVRLGFRDELAYPWDGSWVELVNVFESRAWPVTAGHRATATFLMEHDDTLTEEDREALQRLSVMNSN